MKQITLSLFAEETPAAAPAAVPVNFDELVGRTFGLAYGLGVDSTAIIVELARRKIRPAFILFADVGAEKAATYAYLPIINAWLRAHDMPEVTVIKREPPKAPYRTIEENMLMNSTLPSATFGSGACTMAWKIEPQNKWCKTNQDCLIAWARGEKVVKLIGFEAGEGYRRERANDKAHSAPDPRYDYCYPLMDLGWDRARCKAEILAAGLPVPPKSACIFCPNTKPHELHDLTEDERGRVVRVEVTAEPFNQKVHGLWRRPRKNDGRPGSITEYMIAKGMSWTPIEQLGDVATNPNCRRARDGYTFIPPHRERTLRELIADYEDQHHRELVNSF